jgi:DNA-binding beta-propeller fold protein YncE
MTTTSNLKKIFATAVLTVSLNGCSGNRGPTTAVFFPPAPNPPRIQYLTEINNSTDIEGRKNSFSIFVFGEQEADKIRSIAKPYGITTSGNRIYICDMGSANIFVTDPQGKNFSPLKGNYNMGKLKKPANLTVDRQGNIFVADVERKEIVTYDAAGNYRQSFGKEYNMKPVDVAVDETSLYVLDLLNNEIKVINRKDGTLSGTIGKDSNESDQLSLATNLTMDEGGFLYVTNAGSGKILKLDRDGHIISGFGKMGDGFGQFGRPRGIAVDREGRIFVVDAAHQNVQIFDKGGRLLMFFGDPGLPHGSMNLPADVAVSTDNLEYFQKFAAPDFTIQELIFVTNQFGTAKVAVYALGTMEGGEKQPAQAALQETKEAADKK